MVERIEKDGFQVHFIRWHCNNLPIAVNDNGQPVLLLVPDESFNDNRFNYRIEWHIIFLCCHARRLGKELTPNNRWGKLYAFYQVMKKGLLQTRELEGSHQNGIKQTIDVLQRAKVTIRED